MYKVCNLTYFVYCLSSTLDISSTRVGVFAVLFTALFLMSEQDQVQSRLSDIFE